MTLVHKLKKSGWIKHLIGASITVLCLLIIVRQVNFAELVMVLKQVQWSFLTFGIVSLALGYGFRIMRWSVMLRSTGAPVRFGKCSAPFLGSIALNNILPLRLGDVVRALVFPKAMGITRATATSSLVMERLIDLMTLLACMAVGLFAIQVVEIPKTFKESAMYLAVICSIILASGFLLSGPLGRFFSRQSSINSENTSYRMLQIYASLAGLFHSFEAMSRPRVFLVMLLASILVWAGESGLFFFVLLGLGIDAQPTIALLVMSVATLSTLIPSSPGYVGPFHLAAFTAISLVGGTSAQAGAYAVLVHLALWLPTTVAGVMAIWLRPELFRAAREQTI